MWRRHRRKEWRERTEQPKPTRAERIAAQDGNCQTDAWAEIVVATVPAGSSPSAIAVNQFVTAPRFDSWL